MVGGNVCWGGGVHGKRSSGAQRGLGWDPDRRQTRHRRQAQLRRGVKKLAKSWKDNTDGGRGV